MRLCRRRGLSALVGGEDEIAGDDHPHREPRTDGVGWQHGLSVSYVKVGDVQVAQGDLADALTSYRDSLAIADRLSKAGPGNADWQHNLALSYAKIAGILR